MAGKRSSETQRDREVRRLKSRRRPGLGGVSIDLLESLRRPASHPERGELFRTTDREPDQRGEAVLREGSAILIS